MTWVKLDDGFYDHPKVEDLTLAAVGLWTLCASYCGKHLSNGYVSYARVSRLGGTDDLIDELVDAGLWEHTDRGIQFHDWDKYQPTRQSVEDKRAQDRERQRKYRRDKGSGQYTSRRESQQVSHHVSQRDTQRDSRTESQRESQVESHHPDPTRPARPDPNENTCPPAPPVGVRVTRFDEFWEAYPRKVGKQKARAKYAAAVKRSQSEDTVIEGARRLAADPNLPEQKFIPHPTTWLERDGWDDEPLPPPFEWSRSERNYQRGLALAEETASHGWELQENPFETDLRQLEA